MTTKRPAPTGVEIDLEETSEPVAEVPANSEPRTLVVQVHLPKPRRSMTGLTVLVFLLLAASGFGYMAGLKDADRGGK